MSEIEMALRQSPPEKMMFQLTLRRRGISDQAVLRTMEEIPREAFVEEGDRADAYRDSALGIACGQTISQPFVVAYMTEQLQLQKPHRVLEIGTGSGYQAAILSRLCRQVVTVERYRTLADSARARLEKLGCRRWRSWGWCRSVLPAEAPTCRRASRRIPFPIPLPRNRKPPPRSQAPRSSAGNFRNMPARKANLRPRR